MTTVRSGVPGHDEGTAFVRLRRGKLADGPSGQRVQDNTAEGPYEIVCPGCGDDPGRDWSEISEELRRIRGIYGTKQGAEAALMDHLGMQTADSHRPARARRRAAELQPHRVAQRIRENARRPADRCGTGYARSYCGVAQMRLICATLGRRQGPEL